MGLVQSLASVLGISDTSTPVTAGIQEFDVSSYSSVGSIKAFQYFPETITDSKAVDWIRKNVPGGSHPILSFINGGERTISFSLVFTQEENPEEVSVISSLLTGKIELFKDSNRKDTEKNITGAIAYLRSFTYPSYEPNNVASPPPFAVVYLPQSGIVSAGFTNSFIGAMVQCDITYEKFHRNGAPRFVGVQLSFVEVIQTSSNWNFVGRERMLESFQPYEKTMIGVEASKSSLGVGGILAAGAVAAGAVAALRRR
jgi:hypothetical protein